MFRRTTLAAALFALAACGATPSEPTLATPAAASRDENPTPPPPPPPTTPADTTGRGGGGTIGSGT